MVTTLPTAFLLFLTVAEGAATTSFEDDVMAGMADAGTGPAGAQVVGEIARAALVDILK